MVNTEVKKGELITLKARVEKDVGVTLELNGELCTATFDQLSGIAERKIRYNMKVKTGGDLEIRKLNFKSLRIEYLLFRIEYIFPKTATVVSITMENLNINTGIRWEGLNVLLKIFQVINSNSMDALCLALLKE